MPAELYWWLTELDEYPDPPPDLPDHWNFAADWAFWLVSICLAPYMYFLFSLGLPATFSALPVWLALVLAVLAFYYPASMYLITWDSYRWRIPHRTTIVVSSLFLVGGPIYLHARQIWMMRVLRARRLGKHEHSAGELPQC